MPNYKRLLEQDSLSITNDNIFLNATTASGTSNYSYGSATVAYIETDETTGSDIVSAIPNIGDLYKTPASVGSVITYYNLACSDIQKQQYHHEWTGGGVGSSTGTPAYKYVVRYSSERYPDHHTLITNFRSSLETQSIDDPSGWFWFDVYDDAVNLHRGKVSDQRLSFRINRGSFDVVKRVSGSYADDFITAAKYCVNKINGSDVNVKDFYSVSKSTGAINLLTFDKGQLYCSAYSGDMQPIIISESASDNRVVEFRVTFEYRILDKKAGDTSFDIATVNYDQLYVQRKTKTNTTSTGSQFIPWFCETDATGTPTAKTRTQYEVTTSDSTQGLGYLISRNFTQAG